MKELLEYAARLLLRAGEKAAAAILRKAAAGDVTPAIAKARLEKYLAARAANDRAADAALRARKARTDRVAPSSGLKPGGRK